MAISGFLKQPTRYSEPPMDAVLGEIIEALMTLTFTAAGFTTTGLGDLPIGTPVPGFGVMIPGSGQARGIGQSASVARGEATGGIPPGRWRIRTDLSRLKCPAGTATATLDLGLAAYTKLDGSSQALQGTLLANAVVITSAIDQNLATVAPIDVDSRDGIGIVSAVGTANSPASGQILVSLVLQKLPLP